MIFTPTQFVYTWRGRYWGFIRDERLYRASGQATGWLEGFGIWRLDGRYLGQFDERGYVLKPWLFCSPWSRRIPPAWSPAATPPLFRPADRMARLDRFGYLDPLEELNNG